jgi:hypothetical protein
MEINWKEQCKLRIRNSDPSFDKHEICKLIIMLLSKRKHKTIGIYSEYPMYDGTFPDVVIEFNDSFVLYECQTEISPAWIERINNRNKEAPLKLLKKVDTVVVSLKDLSNDLNTLITQLEKYII